MHICVSSSLTLVSHDLSPIVECMSDKESKSHSSLLNNSIRDNIYLLLLFIKFYGLELAGFVPHNEKEVVFFIISIIIIIANLQSLMGQPVNA